MLEIMCNISTRLQKNFFNRSKKIIKNYVSFSMCLFKFNIIYFSYEVAVLLTSFIKQSKLN